MIPPLPGRSPWSGSSLSSRVGHAIDGLSFTESQFAQRGVDHGPRRVFGTYTDAGPLTFRRTAL